SGQAIDQPPNTAEGLRSHVLSIRTVYKEKHRLFGENSVGETRPRLDGPIAELSSGQCDQAPFGRWVPPQERAAAAEMPVGLGGVELAGPVRCLVSSEFGAEPAAVV